GRPAAPPGPAARLGERPAGDGALPERHPPRSDHGRTARRADHAWRRSGPNPRGSLAAAVSPPPPVRGEGRVSVVALTIAGSDPSGGAGVQADLRVFAALDVAGLSAISALTVQDSRGVHAVFPVAAEQLGAQLEAALADSRVRAVKIGMLGD